VSRGGARPELREAKGARPARPLREGDGASPAHTPPREAAQRFSGAGGRGPRWPRACVCALSVC
jgi:hypothetical protein